MPWAIIASAGAILGGWMSGAWRRATTPDTPAMPALPALPRLDPVVWNLLILVIAGALAVKVLRGGVSTVSGGVKSLFG
jgi:Flp pilus assembly pilin Flp